MALDPSAEEDNSDPPPIVKLTEAIQAVETLQIHLTEKKYRQS